MFPILVCRFWLCQICLQGKHDEDLKKIQALERDLEEKKAGLQ